MKANGCDLVVLGERMRLARAHLSLTQASISEQFGLSVRSYQKNEAGTNEAGMCLVADFIRAGINANWLLTGEGPMLLADLVAKPEPPRLNVRALAAILEGILQAGTPPNKAVAAAFEFYQISIDRGLITAEGIGEGREKAA